LAISEVNYNGKTFEISYNLINASEKEEILFLHGWGSNKEIMQQAFGNYLKNFKQIYIDMPGFGNSPNEDFILTTKDYANIISLFLKKQNFNPTIIAGHSFGGKVATLLNPKTLVLISSAGILVPKPLNVKLKIALVKLLKPFKIKALRKLFASNDAKNMNHAMYETFKNVVDEDFSEIFANFKNNALLFWGDKDTATPLWTGQKINSLIKNSKLYSFSGDHYFFLKHAKEISKNIEQQG
jgi:pimeloyl-ACP methyl ester carboxylesterase